MEEKTQIICRFDNSYIESLYFNYLTTEDKNEIKDRLIMNKSIVCAFEIKGNIVFCAILDFEYEENTLQVREVAGTFNQDLNVIAGYQFLNNFCEGFAKFCKLQYIRFHGERPAHKKLFDSFGFQNLGNNDFERKVH